MSERANASVIPFKVEDEPEDDMAEQGSTQNPAERLQLSEAVRMAEAITACGSVFFLICPECMDDAISALRPGCPIFIASLPTLVAALPQPSVNHPHLRFGKYGAPAPRKQW